MTAIRDQLDLESRTLRLSRALAGIASLAMREETRSTDISLQGDGLVALMELLSEEADIISIAIPRLCQPTLKRAPPSAA